MKISPLVSIFLVVLVDILGVTIIFPLLPFYAQRFGASAFVVGQLISTFGLFQLISGPILGALSDRVGRRPVLLVSQLGTFCAYLLLASAQSLPIIFLSRAIDGITAGNITVAQAYISDVTKPADRAKAFGLIGVAFSVGFLLGPGISGFLASFDHRYPIYAAAALSATSILATTFLLKRLPPPENARKGLGIDWRGYVACLRKPELRRLLLQFFAFAFAFSLYFSGFALFAERRFLYNGAPFGPREVGYCFAFSGLMGLLIQSGPLGVLVRRFGEPLLAAVGFTIMAAGILALGQVQALLWINAAVGLIAVGSTLARPSLTSLISQSIEPSRQGMAMGLMQMLVSFAQVAAPIASGLLIERALLVPWTWIAAFLSLVGLRLMRGRRDFGSSVR
ncbi:MAG: MFS transporter [Oligoflexia bacterium]|nr:MFS transporter [Oligoflexia bacterium]